MTVAKRPAPSGDWYTPYFAPTTVIIAITVLFLSIEAGKYAGNYFIERDKTAQAGQMTDIILRAPTKAATHGAPARSHSSTTGKTQHARPPS